MIATVLISLANIIPVPFLAPIAGVFIVPKLTEASVSQFMEQYVEVDEKAPALPSGVTITVEQD